MRNSRACFAPTASKFLCLRIRQELRNSQGPRIAEFLAQELQLLFTLNSHGLCLVRSKHQGTRAKQPRAKRCFAYRLGMNSHARVGIACEFIPKHNANSCEFIPNLNPISKGLNSHTLGMNSGCGWCLRALRCLQSVACKACEASLAPAITQGLCLRIPRPFAQCQARANYKPFPRHRCQSFRCYLCKDQIERVSMSEGRFELPTQGFSVLCSNQLSYPDNKIKPFPCVLCANQRSGNSFSHTITLFHNNPCDCEFTLAEFARVLNSHARVAKHVQRDALRPFAHPEGLCEATHRNSQARNSIPCEFRVLACFALLAKHCLQSVACKACEFVRSKCKAKPVLAELRAEFARNSAMQIPCNCGCFARKSQGYCYFRTQGFASHRK